LFAIVKQLLNRYVRSSVRKPITGLALLCGFALMPLSAVAQGTPEQRAACAGDATRLCGQFIPDVDRITSCMIKVRRDLSPPCRAVLDRGGKTRSIRN
jgi:hypothetical protein